MKATRSNHHGLTLSCLAGILMFGLCSLHAQPAGKATAAEQLTVPTGFKVELIHSATADEGSWICMTTDNKGRLIVSPQKDTQPLLRITLTKDGKVAKVEPIPAQVKQAMGLCYAHDSLYVNSHGPDGTGLYRLIDENHNDQFDTNEVHFLKKMKGEGEHGYHAVVEGPDKMIYVMNGNHTKMPEGLSPDSPHRNYQEDLLLPRLWDANGHAVGILAPGGHVLRTDPEGKKWELVLAGFRNSYDFDFSANGEMFTFDSDMEWDWGLPWYCPTRISHNVTGGEYGWRSGAGRWPDYYADSLPAAVDIGIGCPTGVKFGTKSNFPKKYQQALFAMDWSYGRIFAVNLHEQGATYTGNYENFVKGKPLNVTDLEFGKDGAMYFITGGRGTQSGLYRVSFTGDKALRRELNRVDKPSRAAAKARVLRHKLEAFHGKTDAGAVDFAWPHLRSPDRFIRGAARIAIESQPVATWKDRALAESDTEGALGGLLALARCGGKETQRDLLMALRRFPLQSLPENQQLEKLRVLQVSYARQGRPDADVVKLTAEKLGALYPTKSDLVNRELVQVLIFLEAPDVVGKSLDIIAKAPTLEEQTHYIYQLRNVKTGWTLEQRRKYFAWFTQLKKQDNVATKHPALLLQWFKEADRDYSDGASYGKFLINIRKDAILTLDPREEAALKVLTEENIGAPPWKATKDRPVVKEWTVADLESRLGEVKSKRNFESGKTAFNDAQCIICHRLGGGGGSVGPELAGASSKYSLRDILESMVEPSKVVSDQFLTYNILKKDGESVAGRILDENAERLVIMPNPTSAELLEQVRIADITSRTPSKLSPMPTALLNNLTAEEILDLLAYIDSAAKPDAPNFKH
ncbi:MAG: c-type cytochrome [Verrucomicrobia bacterium]|nr:c-type cytochrome [Verrucomicrobiota bacterium]